MASGVELATAWVRLVPSADGIQGELGKTLGPEAEKAGDEAGKKAGNSMSAGLKTALVAGAAVAVAGLVAVFKTGMEELKFGEELNAQTDQLVKNTGFALSTDQINNFTLALSKISGISEEDLQAAGNNILKFGDVSKKTYQRSVDAINNMGAAGKDVAGTSEALGKALADPTKAAGLLKRQGVLLNQEQQDLIDNFTRVGDKAGAQRVILDALEGTYGGMAEAAGGTLTGNINKLQNAWENMAGDIVSLVMPAAVGLIGVLQNVVSFLSENQGVMIAIAAVIGTVLVVAFIAWAASIWAATVALLANPVTWIILAIVALIAIIILLVLNWDAVAAFLMDVWNNVVNWLVGTFNNIMAWWNNLWTTVWEFIVSVWTNIVNWVSQAITNVRNVITVIGASIALWWNNLWTGIGNFFRDAWNGIAAVVGTIGKFFGDAFNNVASIVKGAFSGVVGVIRGVVNNIIGVVNGAIDGINNLTGAAAAVGVSIPKIPHIPMLAKGGTITGAGSVIVGERGPELLNLPKGASVNPDIAGGSLPEHITLVDESGALLGRMKVVASDVVASDARDNTVDLTTGRRKVA